MPDQDSHRVVRALGYVRVSKAREEMISPELQISAITDYCQRTGAILTGIITDLDATGRNFAREGIQQAISQVEHGQANLVVVWKWSRFGRNVRDCLINIDRLEAAGGRLVAATEDFDDTPVGRFGRGQFLLMAQFESERIGEQWKEAQARRLRQGLPYNGRPRYGYTYTRGTGYTPDPVTAPIVADLYARYLAGETPPALAKSLNAAGIRAPQGGTWWGTTVQQVMETGFAAGLLRINTRGASRGFYRGTWVQGTHPAIITLETWEAYKRKRQVHAASSSMVRSPRHPLAGLLRCGTCGGSMYRSGAVKLICSARAQGRDCAKPAYTRLSVALDAVEAWLVTISSQIDSRASQAAQKRQGKDEARAQVRTLTREVTRLERALVKLTRDYAQAIIPQDAYLQARDSLQAEQRAAAARVTALTDALHTPQPAITPNLLRDWPTLDTAGQQGILTAVISHIQVHPQGRGRKPTFTVVPKWGRTTDDG